MLGYKLYIGKPVSLQPAFREVPGRARVDEEVVFAVLAQDAAFQVEERLAGSIGKENLSSACPADSLLTQLLELLGKGALHIVPEHDAPIFLVKKRR